MFADSRVSRKITSDMIDVVSQDDSGSESVLQRVGVSRAITLEFRTAPRISRSPARAGERTTPSPFVRITLDARQFEKLMKHAPARFGSDRAAGPQSLVLMSSPRRRKREHRIVEFISPNGSYS